MNHSKAFKALSLASLLTLASTQAHAYNVVDRYKLIDDKLKTEQMLRPIGHDFFLDIGASLNKNVKDVIDDIKVASKAATVTAATDALVKYDKTEQTIKVNVGLGTPLPSFSAWDLKMKPNLRVFVDFGANLGIRSQVLTPTDVLNFFSEDIPADFKTFVLGLTAGTDVIASCKASTTLSTTTKAFCATQATGKYIIPNLSQTIPSLALFGKGDAKAGFFNDYTYGEHFFGNFNLYGLGRADIYQLVTAEQVAKGQTIEAPKKMNTEVTLQTDYRLGYNNANYRIFAGVEEIKLSKIKDAPVGGKPQQYGYDPLIRIHGDALFKYSILSFNPFAGVHKRTGYSFSDGVYAGADLGAHVWGDRIGLQFRGMADKQYITFSPRVKLWLMQLEYSLKAPLKSMDGDVKLSAINSIDLRLFF